MIIFGIVACYFSTLTQCGAVYDHVNIYASPQACLMHIDDMKAKEPDKFTDDEKFRSSYVCMEFRGPKKKIVPFLMMMEGYHAKEKA